MNAKRGRAVDDAETIDSLTTRRDGTEPASPAVDPVNRLRIGRYVVLAVHGRGGAGTVYAAYDDRLDRKVALKVLQPGRRGDEDEQARLWREAQAMAQLSHPNVVTVHEVGRDADGVFVAMEFLSGESLNTWRRSAKPEPQQVLDVYVRAGQGLAAAHAVGLIHRDFKPHNVVRTDDGAVKVLDFGLARTATETSLDGTNPRDMSLSLASSLTRSGLVAGTPAYMSPEQHEGGLIDERSDQYSFCLSLWEGLCGTRPFVEGDERSLWDAKRQGPPPWPTGSARVPRAVVTAIRRGLAVDPNERWPSMHDLLAELAWDPRRRRQRWVLGIVGGGVVALGGAASWSWAQARAERCSGASAHLQGVWDDERRAEVEAAILGIERPYAGSVWQQTEGALSSYAGEWATAHTEACEATTIRREQSAAAMELQMRCLDRARVELRATVDTLSGADEGVVRRAHQLTGGLQPLARCGDVERLREQEEHGPPPLAEEAEAVEEGRRHLADARSLIRGGLFDASQRSLEEARVALSEVEYVPVRVEQQLAEGAQFEAKGDYAEAEAAFVSALELGLGQNLRTPAANAAMKLMYVLSAGHRRADEALRYWSLVQGLVAGDDSMEMAARGSYAMLSHTRGDYEAAEAEFRAVYEYYLDSHGPQHHTVARVQLNIANALYGRGRLEESAAVSRASLAAFVAALGPQHPNVAAARLNLATTLGDLGHLDEAEAEARAGLVALEAAQGAEHPDLAMVRLNLANLLDRQGRSQEADEENRRALELFEKTLGPEHPNVATLRLNIAAKYEREDRFDEAEPLIRSALAIFERTLGPDHPNLAVPYNNLGAVLEGRGQDDEAEVEYRAAVELRARVLDADHPKLARSRYVLARFLLKRGGIVEALPLAEQAWARLRQPDSSVEARSKCAFVLARLLWAHEAPQRDRQRARELAAATAKQLRASGEDHAELLRDVEQWITAHPR
ncbi:MAG: serine/threonine-protein kinase [Myxococcota bacterium]